MPNFQRTQPMQPTSGRRIGEDFYVYSAFVETLAAASTLTTSIQIEADSNFEIIKMAQFTIGSLGGASITESTRIVPIAAILFTDTGSGRNLFNREVPMSSLFGTGERPFILPRPRLLLSRSTLQIQITNLSTAVSYDRIQIDLIGSKIFESGMGAGY